MFDQCFLDIGRAAAVSFFVLGRKKLTVRLSGDAAAKKYNLNP
jgi:hypothetical protein